MPNWFEWIQNPSLRAAADLVVNGGRLPQEDARRVINNLQEESVYHIAKVVGDEFFCDYFPTDRHGPDWEDGQPVGIVDHYTAGVTVNGPLRWFSSQKRGKGVGTSSAHYVIDREGRIFQLINPLEKVAWHARSFSYTHIGIEHVNAGVLRQVNGQFRYLNIRPYPKDREDQLQLIAGEYWEPYTVPQVVANIVLKRWLLMAIPTLQEENFIDHQMADPERKLDCGPLWPLQDVNALAASDKPLRDMLWLDGNYLSQSGLFELHREVWQTLTPAPPASSRGQ